MIGLALVYKYERWLARRLIAAVGSRMPRLQPITTQCSEQDQQMINLSNSINYHRSAKNAKSKKIYAYLSYELGDQFWFFDHLGASH